MSSRYDIQECPESTSQGRPLENVITMSLRRPSEDVLGTLWDRLLDIPKIFFFSLNLILLSCPRLFD